MAPNTATTTGIDPDDYDVRAYGLDDASEAFDEFLADALDEAVRTLAENAQSPHADTGDVDDYRALVLDEPLDPDNVRQIDVRGNDFREPTVRVWLRDCPQWANTAESCRLINTTGTDNRALIDVRPF